MRLSAAGMGWPGHVLGAGPLVGPLVVGHMPSGLVLPLALQGWLLFLSFALGGALGSFFGLVVARLPHQQSVVWPRSYCDACGRQLQARELVPVLSFLGQGGKSRCCRQPLGLRMLWLELVMGGMGCALLVRLGLSWQALAWLPLAGALLAIALLDIDHWWVPDVLSLPSMALGLAIALLPGGHGLASAALGLLPAAFLWLFAAGYLRASGKEGMGLGDIKILAIVGLALGGWSATCVLILACLQGTVLGGLVLLLGGHRPPIAATPPEALAHDDWVPPASAVPFGPFLALATFEVLFVPQLAAWPLALYA